LFCPGIPRAGKILLTSIVIDDLITRFYSDSSIGIAFVYCNFRSQHKQKAEDLLASLLKQLVQGQPLPDVIKSLHNKHKDKGTQPSFDELLSALYIVAAMYLRVFIIVDALDECEESANCRTKFLSGIFELQAKSGASLFATSRFISEVTAKFKGCLEREIFERGFCQTDDDFEERLRSNQFFEYAAQNWGHHARNASTSSQVLSLAYVSFLISRAGVDALSQGLFAIKRHSWHSNYSQKVPRRMTALHLVAYLGVKAVVKLLLKNKADINLKDDYGYTPLSRAAQEGHEAIVKLLLKNEASIDLKDNFSHTPLFWAIYARHEAIVKLLLENKASVDLKDNFSHTVTVRL